jgi:hypothetical protein
MESFINVPVPSSAVGHAGNVILNLVQNILGNWFWVLVGIAVLGFVLFSRRD